MESNPLNVLLLGWDEAAPAADAASVAALDLSRQLAEHVPVSVIVPRLSDSETLTSADQVIRLNLLSAAQLAAQAMARPAAAAGSWQAPAAPYAGASAPPTAPQSEVAAAAQQGTAAPASAATQGTALAATPSPASRSATARPTLLNEDDFAEATAEIGADEAADIHQPADNLTLEASAVPTAASVAGQPAPATPAAAQTAAQASFVQALNALDNAEDDADLNFRVIQYARFATPLAVSQPFGVVYAADWHAWLAGLEIRQLTGRPLVLHVQTLAADRDSPADRGWILELERLALRRADLVLASTEALAQRLISFYNIPAARIRVVAADDTTALNDALTQVTPRS
ncbi:glycosyltransferase [Hymenobacter chitinivorans]|uniref:Glycosyl transferase family 4 n=1 Tax=Hymenobacter chitinivorans DSM 11115 TaxID=1121954 RepID=A0A2M9AQV6_9BACT|nr:glycosyltransferase [Hymenobacter chitinivorans]PJJ48085.1 glycosyl transferase family 4 [Hymenobacter chitinivorans DSM 11115]